MLQLQDLSLRVVGKLLFEDVNVHIPDGHLVGIVGRNGTGKTSLFRLILGDYHADSGDILFPKDWMIGTVSQDPPSGDITPLEVVMASDKERASLNEELDNNPATDRLAEIHARLVEIEGFRSEGKAAKILRGLGFSHDDQGQPMSTFSGGWRMRVSLAAALFLEPELLLLDEPTNHLDVEAAIWLESYLKHYPKTILLISHERAFLNNVAKSILHLESKRMKLYAGNYDTFQRTKAEQELQAGRAREKAEDQIKHMQSFVDRFKAKATKAKQAQSRVKAIEKIKEGLKDNAVERVGGLRFGFASPEMLAPPLLTIRNGEVGYEPEKPVLTKILLTLNPDDRIGLLGANGNGKSTLAKLISKELMLEKGDMFQSSKLKIGFFAQYQIESLDMDSTAFVHILRHSKDLEPQKIRSYLGRFGFSGDRADQKVATLSGGEKTRLNFALISLDKPHLLILDEPTNHLDIDAREALADTLKAYQGAVIIISHDFYFLNQTVNDFWLVADGTVSPYKDGLKAYKNLILNETGEKKSKSKPKKNKQVSKEPPKIQQPTDAIQRIEKKLAELKSYIVKLDKVLLNPNAYKDSSIDYHALSQQKAEIEGLVAKLEEKWLSLSS
jgi:ATP-binding cassette, subfamily F, member 3